MRRRPTPIRTAARAVRATVVLVALLALPIGLTSSLAEQALLRVGVWLDGETPGGGLGSGRLRTEAELAAYPVAASPLAQWRAAALASLADPLPLALPYAETLTAGLDGADPMDAFAFELTVEAPRPRVLRVASVAGAGARGGLVLDVFDADDVDAAGLPRALGSFGPENVEIRLPMTASAPRGARTTVAGATRLIVRVQPTPGAAGRFAFALDTLPALGFPVATDAVSPVKSFFGMPRDGGRREHHGIDVFAARGTPVLAAADGTIARTGDSPRGGLHVWQRAVDDSGAALGALYYAHLDRIDVAAGDRVTRGTPLGTVGNTGNARTTPPHLHFGLYRRFSGPEDPLPLTGERRVRATPLAPGSALPRWLVVRTPRANLRAGPGTDRSVAGSVERGELVRIDAVAGLRTDAGAGDWVRVRTGAGIRAWIARSLLGPPDPVPIDLTDAGDRWLADGFELRAGPRPGSATLARIDDPAGVERLGRHGAAVLLRTRDGLAGWASESPAP